MNKQIIALLLLFALVLTSCGALLPEGDNPGYKGGEATAEQQAADDIESEKTVQTVASLLDYDKAAEERRLQEEEQQEQKAQPITEASAEYASLITDGTKEWMRAFLADFPSTAYAENRENRRLKDIRNGVTGEEINGGYEPIKTSEKTGYWRVINCTYYNSIFFTDGTDNTTRVLFRADLFHYTLKENENLAEESSTELTTDNSEIREYKDAFLVAGIDHVTVGNVEKRELNDDQIIDTMLMFESYEDAINSFKDQDLKVEEMRIDENYKMILVDGYKGKPIVQMPKLVGKFIDIANPRRIKDLDDMEITNYEVIWIQNDGSMVPYSIVSCSVEEGTLVDITDMSKDARIRVEVAEKPAEEASSEEG